MCNTHNSYCIDAQFCERHIKHLLYGRGFADICRKCEEEARLRFMSHHAHHTATTTATVVFEASVTVLVIVLVACVCRRPSIPHQYSISLPCTHSMWRATRSHPTSRRRRTRSRHTSGGESPRCDPACTCSLYVVYILAVYIQCCTPQVSDGRGL